MPSSFPYGWDPFKAGAGGTVRFLALFTHQHSWRRTRGGLFNAIFQGLLGTGIMSSKYKGTVTKIL